MKIKYLYLLIIGLSFAMLASQISASAGEEGDVKRGKGHALGLQAASERDAIEGKSRYYAVSVNDILEGIGRRSSALDNLTPLFTPVPTEELNNHVIRSFNISTFLLPCIRTHLADAQLDPAKAGKLRKILQELEEELKDSQNKLGNLPKQCYYPRDLAEKERAKEMANSVFVDVLRNYKDSQKKGFLLASLEKLDEGDNRPQVIKRQSHGFKEGVIDYLKELLSVIPALEALAQRYIDAIAAAKSGKPVNLLAVRGETAKAYVKLLIAQGIPQPDHMDFIASGILEGKRNSTDFRQYVQIFAKAAKTADKHPGFRERVHRQVRELVAKGKSHAEINWLLNENPNIVSTRDDWDALIDEYFAMAQADGSAQDITSDMLSTSAATLAAFATAQADGSAPDVTIDVRPVSTSAAASAAQE